MRPASDSAVVANTRDRVGEGPVWIAAEAALYWVDVLAPAVNRLSFVDGSVQQWAMPEPIGFIVPRRSQTSFVVGLQSGFYALRLDRRIIYRFDLDEDGSLHNKAPFIHFADDWGLPDGMTVDAEGYLWVAHWDGGRVSRFDPDGGFVRAVFLPASRVTSCTFAGPALDRLFVTSARDCREHEPLAGALFELAPGVAGLPAGAFAG